MAFLEVEKKRDQSPILTALIVGAAVFSIVWFLRSLSTALAMAAAAALFTWGTSTWLQASGAKITFRGAISTALCGFSERKNKFQGKELIIPLVVGVAAWGVSKFLVSKFLALMVGGAVGWQMYKRLEEKRRLQEEEEKRRLQMLEEKRRLREEEEKRKLQEAERRRLQEEKRRLQEEERRNKRAKEVVSSTALGFGAFAIAGVAALAAWGLSKSGDDGLDGETSSDEDKKMMKAPGRDYYMPRKDFEDSPVSYFRRLRGKEY